MNLRNEMPNLLQRIGLRFESGIARPTARVHITHEEWNALLALFSQPMNLCDGPAAARYDFDGFGWQYIDNGSGSGWASRIEGAELLYTRLKPEPVVGKSVPDYWVALDGEGNIERAYSTDGANGGLAARQEINDWINEHDPSLRLVGLCRRSESRSHPASTVSDADAKLRMALESYDRLSVHVGGCTDGGCVIVRPKGMHTNGGCKCADDRLKARRMMQQARMLSESVREYLAAAAGR